MVPMCSLRWPRASSGVHGRANCTVSSRIGMSFVFVRIVLLDRVVCCCALNVCAHHRSFLMHLFVKLFSFRPDLQRARWPRARSGVHGRANCPVSSCIGK